MRDKLLAGRYRVVNILAVGGFGQTYVALDTHRPGNPKCVVKLLLPTSDNPSSLQNARRLFQSEAETLEKLGNHDQIPRLLAYFEENQEFYLVQDFIQGHLLRAELQPGWRWTESQVCQLLQEVLNILVFVHSQGVIHRDIKPTNLIRRQQDNRLVLIDFGSVKQAWTQVVTSLGKTCTTFATGIPATIAIGTPGYMPIEQERGRPRPNSDIYAIGMIGIQALTGLNSTQLLENSDTGDIIWQHQAHVSDALASVLTKMVRYHFKDRYQTATEALQALQLLANSQPPTELGSDAEAPPEQQPRTLLQTTEEEITPTTVYTGGLHNNGLRFFSSMLENSRLEPLPHCTTHFHQPTVLFPHASQDRFCQNIIPVAIANSSVTPVGKRAISGAGGAGGANPMNESRGLRLIAGISIPNRDLNTTTVPALDIVPRSNTGHVLDSNENRYSAPQPIVLSPLDPLAPSSSSQNVIPDAHMRIVRGAEEQGRDFYSFVVCANNQHRLLIWARIAAVLISVVIGYSIYWQARPSTEKTLEQIETLIVEGKYEECVNQAKTVPQDSRFYTYAQALLHECQIAQAMGFAAQGNFKAAITEASKIPQDAAYYQDAQQLIGEWSDSILEIATNKYQSGKLNDAIAIANAISKTSPVYQKAQGKINQWNKEWGKNNSYFTAANIALDKGRWQNALSEAKKVIDTPYWQEMIKPIIQKAELKIAESKAAVNSKPKHATIRSPRATTRSTRTTPGRSTRTTPGRSTRTTHRRLTRTTPRPLRRSAPPKPSYTWTTETVP